MVMNVSLKEGISSMTASTLDLATAYLAAWQRKDVAAIAKHLDPQVHFTGPMMDVTGRDAVIASAERILPLLLEFNVRSTLVSHDRAMFAYDFVCHQPIGTCRTAELVTFEEGLIKTIELFYDARPFEKTAGPAATGLSSADSIAERT
jgi:hypothetical protein